MTIIIIAIITNSCLLKDNCTMIDPLTSIGSRQCDHYNCHLDYIHHVDHHANNHDDH